MNIARKENNYCYKKTCRILHWVFFQEIGRKDLVKGSQRRIRIDMNTNFNECKLNRVMGQTSEGTCALCSMPSKYPSLSSQWFLLVVSGKLKFQIILRYLKMVGHFLSMHTRCLKKLSHFLNMKIQYCLTCYKGGWPSWYILKLGV